jgi:NADH-quinone oxidoreductase subunit N
MASWSPNSFSKGAGLIILACGIFTVLSSQTYFKLNKFCSTEYYSLTVFAASGMLLLTMAQELISVFVALEIMSLAIYILVGYDRTNVISAEAVLKYLMLGAFAGAFFTMGSAFVYGGTVQPNLPKSANMWPPTVFCSRRPLLVEPFLFWLPFCLKWLHFPFMPGSWMSMTVPLSR